MCSELIMDNKPQCAYTDFDLEVVQNSNPKPMIGLTPISQEGMILPVWTKIPIAADFIPKPKQKKQKKELPKK